MSVTGLIIAENDRAANPKPHFPNYFENSSCASKFLGLWSSPSDARQQIGAKRWHRQRTSSRSSSRSGSSTSAATASAKKCSAEPRVNIFDAGSWQLAWDRYPDLYERRQALSALRFPLMEARDAILYRERQAAERRVRAASRKTALKRCATCGEYSRVAA